MARLARWGLRVAVLGGEAVDAREQALDFIAVAFRTDAGNECGGGPRVMGRTMAAGTCLRTRAQQRVHALGQIGGFIGVAGRAIHLRDSRRMGKLLDVGVAIRATGNGVHALLVPGLVYENTLAGCRPQIFLPVTCEAIGVRIGRSFRLSASNEREGIENKYGTHEQRPAPDRTQWRAGQFWIARKRPI
jgi:hypothetical protein